MIIIDSKSELETQLSTVRVDNRTIGLVPTMGALHNGHAELVRRCVEENDFTVVSVFVNPTQFNNQEDLQLYPRTPDADFALLRSLGVDYLFAPTVEEMYPEQDNRKFDFGNLETVMEGKFRPGHFNGVAQIVSKLFYATKPDRAYFGEKDFQQLQIIKTMTAQLNLPVEIIPVPIVREPNGLAMSSRNKRLSAEEQQTATNGFKFLQESLLLIKEKTVSDTCNFVTNSINNTSGLRVEYYQIVNAKTLQPISDWKDAEEIIGCLTFFCGNVRLIDNIRYK